MSLRLGAETYAVPVEHVIEVAELGVLTPVPGARPALLGVRNLRGDILPVFDLGSALGVGDSRVAGGVLVTESDGVRAGFAIDAVIDVGMLPPVSEDTHSPLLSGAVLADSGLVGVVDVPRLFLSLSSEVA